MFARIVPYGILVSLVLLMLMCLAFCVLDQKEREAERKSITNMW